MIVVEHNYRLSEFGFLYIDALRTEWSANTTGNYGIQDQQAALKFTHDNIVKFGGDNKRITIFGESAGGMSVCWHMVSPISRAYFSGAIMESGSCVSSEFFVSPQRAQAFSLAVVKKYKCDLPNATDMLSCLRKVSYRDLFMTGKDWAASVIAPPLAPIMPWGPAIDGTAAGLFDRPINLIRKGQVARVPWIMGTNKVCQRVICRIYSANISTFLPNSAVTWGGYFHSLELKFLIVHLAFVLTLHLTPCIVSFALPAGNFGLAG